MIYQAKNERWLVAFIMIFAGQMICFAAQKVKKNRYEKGSPKTPFP
jgi:hypothetical protein